MKILKYALLMLVLSMAQVSLWAGEPYWMQFDKSVTVKGTPNIESFVEAIFGTPKSDWSTDPVWDLRNGYFAYSEEGDGHLQLNVSYWNRKDGKKLVVVSYSTGEFGQIPAEASVWGYRDSERIEVGDGYDYVNEETGFRAYLFDAQSKKLVPMQTPPVKGWTNVKQNHYYLELPQKGKDIRVREKAYSYYNKIHYLRWNGTEFELESCEPVQFYVRDKSGTKTNVRNEPSGKVKAQLEQETMMAIDYCDDGWCHIANGLVWSAVEENDNAPKLPQGEYWIHHSVIGATGLGDGRVKLLAEPKEGAAVAYENQQEEIVRPIAIEGQWVKVRVDGKKAEGWIKCYELCSNPLTNCN